jgi:hypothetical protein
VRSALAVVEVQQSNSVRVRNVENDPELTFGQRTSCKRLGHNLLAVARHSITSSAPAINPGGTSMPSARLMANWNLLACTYRKVGRLGALEDLTRIGADRTKHIRHIGVVAHQAVLRGSRFLRAPLQISKRATSEATEFSRSGVEFLGVISAARLECGEPPAETGELIRW